jgi:nucleolar protein 14
MGKKKRAKSYNPSSAGKKFDAFAKAKANPFDIQNNKRSKQDVLGRKIKGSKRNVSEARTREKKSRDETLLEEMKQRGKVNQFVDKRFGEDRKDVTQEEKDLARFIKLQKQRFKGNKFNLRDDYDDANDGTQLTHKGKPLAGGMLSGGLGQDDSDEDDAGLSAEVVEQLHFGGGSEKLRPDGSMKTKEEIYAELIAKSKKYRAERARQKAHDEREMESLDDQLDGIRGLLDFRPTKEQERQEMFARLANKDGKKRKREPEEKDAYSEYDEIRRGLVFDARAAASDRMKTEEEKAKEEKERLEKMEAARLKRMSEDGDETASAKPMRGDDLGVNYAVDNDDLKGEDASSDEGFDSEKEDEEIRKEIEREEDAGEYDPAEELPYVLECPATLERLDRVINRWCPPNREGTGEKLFLVFSRIHKLTSIHLRAENRGKLGKLFTLLLAYVTKMKAFPAAGKDYFDKLCVVMYKLLQDSPVVCVNAYRDMLELIQKRATVHVTRARKFAAQGGGGDYGEKDVRLRCWPSGGELLALKMLGVLFPVSDFRHPITTPAVLLFGQLLTQCPVRGPKDLAAGIFLSGLQMYFGESARRLAPEAINFLSATVARLCIDAKKSKADDSVLLNVNNILARCPPLAAAHLGWLRAKAFQKGGGRSRSGINTPVQVSLRCFFRSTEKKVSSSAICCGTIGATLSLLTTALTMYGSNSALPEMFSNLSPVVGHVLKLPKDMGKKVGKYPDALSQLEETLGGKLSMCLSASLKSRAPLLMQKEVQRPKAIVQYRPMFDEEYIVRKDNDPNKERAEIKKLKKQIARERKGAAREIRKDALYIAREAHQKDLEWEEETKKKYNSVIDFLDKQQAGFKQAVKDGTGHGGGMKAGRRKKKVKAF